MGTGINGNIPEYEGILFVDPIHNRLGVNNPYPAYDLDVNGVINATSVMGFNGSYQLLSASNFTCSNFTNSSNLQGSNATFNGNVIINNNINIQCIVCRQRRLL